METERTYIAEALRRSRGKSWLLLGPSSEQLIPLATEFLGIAPRDVPWAVTPADEDETLHVHLHDGHIWIDGEAIRPCPLEVWRKYLLNLSEGTTLDQHLNRGCRWIIVRGIEVLSPEHLGCLADCLGRGGRGWLLMGAASSFSRYQRLAQRALWWIAGPEAFSSSPAYRLTLPAKATMSSFTQTWTQFMKGRATLEELDESWLQLLARDVSWDRALALMVQEVLLHAPSSAQGRHFLQALLETERRPRQRDIFTWRWILRLAQETFSTSKLLSE